MAKRTLTSIEIPQADSLENVRRVVETIASGPSSRKEISEKTDISLRHVDYAIHAAKSLGFLAEGDSLAVSDAGRALIATARSSDDERSQLRAAFKANEVLEMLAPDLLAEATPSKSSLTARIQQACPELSEATATRRAQTLLAWRTQALSTQMSLPLVAPEGASDAAPAAKAAKADDDADSDEPALGNTPVPAAKKAPAAKRAAPSKALPVKAPAKAAAPTAKKLAPAKAGAKKPEAKKADAKKPAAKVAEAKKPEAKKADAKKPAVKVAEAKKPAAKVAEAKKPEAKKADAKKPAAKVALKADAKKPEAKKVAAAPAAKKAAPKAAAKPAATKPAAKKALPTPTLAAVADGPAPAREITYEPEAGEVASEE